MDAVLNLRERTILIAAPFSTTVQNLMMGLTQLGADVALVDKEAQQAQRFCNQINDQREINDRHGRAGAFNADFSNKDQVKDAVGRVAQTVDVLVDAMGMDYPAMMMMTTEEMPLFFQKHLQATMMITELALNFMKSKKRGRIIYLVNAATLRGQESDAMMAAARGGLVQYAQTMGRMWQDFNTTVNVLSPSLTEEYLLKHFPECTSIKEAQEKMKVLDPKLRLTDADRITSVVAFLASAQGAGVTGQILTVS
jgi:NAD(P)-dependent dehydrogenase (short-subunit alcohol dehydrogenase family)